MFRVTNRGATAVAHDFFLLRLRYRFVIGLHNTYFSPRWVCKGYEYLENRQKCVNRRETLKGRVPRRNGNPFSLAETRCSTPVSGSIDDSTSGRRVHYDCDFLTPPLIFSKTYRAFPTIGATTGGCAPFPFL